MIVTRIHHALIGIALFGLLGGHGGSLQLVAWGQMLVERSGESSLVDAVMSTFSGDAPCDLCLAIKDGNSQEKNAPATRLADAKKDVAIARPCPVGRLLPPPDPSLLPLPPDRVAATSRSEAPPLPPPRTAPRDPPQPRPAPTATRLSA